METKSDSKNEGPPITQLQTISKQAGHETKPCNDAAAIQLVPAPDRLQFFAIAPSDITIGQCKRHKRRRQSIGSKSDPGLTQPRSSRRLNSANTMYDENIDAKGPKTLHREKGMHPLFPRILTKRKHSLQTGDEKLRDIVSGIQFVMPANETFSSVAFMKWQKSFHESLRTIVSHGRLEAPDRIHRRQREAPKQVRSIPAIHSSRKPSHPKAHDDNKLHISNDDAESLETYLTALGLSDNIPSTPLPSSIFSPTQVCPQVTPIPPVEGPVMQITPSLPDETSPPRESRNVSPNAVARMKRFFQPRRSSCG
ncbi:hypothetical protein AeMF1_007022 [Aphanomyces euteiches]|nr:hypothetical protein AeMF1_007022 [Aphanomyces euteiches]